MDRRPERELIPMALTHGTAVIPWSELVSGFLIGKYKRGQERPAGSRLEKANEWADKFITDKVFDTLEGFEDLADEKACTLSQFAKTVKKESVRDFYAFKGAALVYAPMYRPRVFGH